MSLCNSCGAGIFWARTESGKLMPVDAISDSNGNVLVVWPGESERTEALAFVGRARGDAALTQHGGGDWHTSHFATCLNASKHRRKR